ncbi:histidine kinase [Porphyrobacter sp. HT-58-2]|uniref:PAS domain-containing sensor histidine kinase n=1 Tax=Porphyrobacter sp. HT-58-2 TaxID=2023229 RepID=UPI000CDC128D|nr:PAS domain-containing sensor histidine kinase [Porphyrobacter sp. HT-58-2]AUX69790.1 histidine kinase [Porphyrobacter sp. HT-58-2]
MDVTPLSLLLIALVLAAWAVGAGVVVLRANRSVKRTKAMRTSLKRMQTLLDVAPALPMLVRIDGRIEAPEKLARLLGLTSIPQYLSELVVPSGQPKAGGLAPQQIEELWAKIQTTQKSAAPFRMALNLPGSRRSLALYGTLADPQVSPGGAALVWVFDFSESHAEMARLRAAAARATGDFAALVGLIEAAPMPMWFRGSDLTLQLVNQAYVDAVGATSAAEVVQSQIELLEPENERSPAEIAASSLQTQDKSERIVAATIHGARRTLRVSDLPLGQEGVAGYAIDIEEQQQVAREFRAFRDAQRALLDQLSVGVALFDAEERLTFANRPFRRLFSVNDEVVEARTSFERFLAEARERGLTPEVRDFPEWRRERTGWFGMRDAVEEAWPLPGGTHLRVVAQPMPDGGLVLITEDRTESLALSAVRDTLLRTRTATLDSLFEALAIFAPDGSVQLWNRSFAGTWGLSTELLDQHPSADELLTAIGRNLVRPEEAGLIGGAVRAATLDRREKGGQVELADGRTLRFAGIPLPDGNGLLTVLDITASQKAEQALRERAEALDEANAVKARFLANMSYEFRTPLTTIGGYAELLKSGVASDPEQSGEYVDAILAAVERLTEQVENVLDLSQSEAGLLPIRKERLDLLDFLTKLVREREEAIIAAGLSLDLKGRRGRIIEADPRQMGRAMGNLIDNAIGGTPEGGRIVIEIRRLADGGPGAGMEVTIADNGKGMSSAELARAMGGVRAEKDAAPERRTGLGIPLARQLIEAHDGTLEIISRKGAGTTATIRLP